jgi:carboxymethylenebutenolidase
VATPVAGTVPAVDVDAEIIDADTPAGPMAILRKRPAAAGSWPKVVMFHDGPGIRNATHAFAAKLAAEGYDVVVPHLYHRHGRLIGYAPAERAADPTLVDRLWELLRSLTDTGIQDDLDATLVAIGAGRDERLGTIGFCVGARAVARTLSRLPDRFVVGAMWHPSFLVDDEPDSPHHRAGGIRQPLFIGIGDADQMQPVAAHRAFFDAVAPLPHVEVEIYPGADHGYTWEGWPTFDAGAAEGSFAKTRRLFATHLPAPGRADDAST